MNFIEINNIKLSIEDIDKLYNCYIDAVTKLAKKTTFGMFQVKYDKISNGCLDKYNPYLTNDEDWMTNLGRSVVNNGSQWIFIKIKNKWLSGNHRILSLRKLQKLGEIPMDYKVLAIDISIRNWGKRIEIQVPTAENINDLREKGLHFEKKSVINYREWISNVIRIPRILKQYLYEYKRQTGVEYKPQLLVNDINELKRCIENVK